MIKVGDAVFVLPAHSIAFAGKWGKVVEINPEELLPIKVMFGNNPIPYLFDYIQLMEVEDYYNWFNISVPCRHRDTGETVEIRTKLFPQIVSMDGETFLFKELYPITTCEYCGGDTTGEFSKLCQDCAYPLPE